MKAFSNILGVVDWSGNVEQQCSDILALAADHQARATIATLTQELPRAIGSEGESLRRGAQQEAMRRDRELDDWIAARKGRLEIDRIILDGPAFLAIIRRVLSAGHDLVLKNAEDPEWSERIFGSDDMHLLRKCPCPVWLTKPGYTPQRRILVPVKLADDAAESARQGRARDALNRALFELAHKLASMAAAEVHVVHAWEAPGESLMSGGFAAVSERKIKAYVELVEREHAALLGSFLHQMEAALPRGSGGGAVGVRRHLLKGRAEDVIASLARRIEADLVVMGTVGRAGVPGLLIGNTAESILGRLQCPVLAVKPQGFVTPVS